MFEYLENYTKKLKKGNLYTIAGRPGMGKTTIARHIANILTENGHKVLYIDTEGISEKGKFKRRNDKFDYLYQRLISVEEVRNITFIGKYNIVVIDNFQYMYHKRMPYTSYRLKRFAEELNVVVIVLSHISRKIDARKNHNPCFLDMPRKMCGSLRESSDNVMFLRRWAYYEPDRKNDIMDFVFLKDIECNSERFQIDFMKLKEIWNDEAYE